MKRLSVLFFILGSALVDLRAADATIPAAERFVRVEGKSFVAPDGKPLLLRGINLGNWLLPEGYMWHFKKTGSPRQIENVVAELVGDVAAAEFWRQWYDTYITREDLALIRRAGFNSVRIPLNWRLFVSERAPFELEGPGWALLDRAIGWCRDEKLYVVLDLHGAPGGQTGANIDDSRGRPLLFDDPAAQALTIRLWEKLARRYRDETWVLGHDLLNEPIADYHDQSSYNPRLAEFYRRIVPAVRAVDPHHVIFLAGAQWNTQFEVLGPPPANDANVAYTCHLYWAEPVQKSIQRYLDWREKTDRPMWLGETGENQDEWIAQFRALLEAHDIGWCFWPYKKMDATSCVASFPRPDDWAAIVAYAETPRGDDYDAIRKALPPLETGRRALAQLLENVRVPHVRVNGGYVQALGLAVPTAETTGPAAR